MLGLSSEVGSGVEHGAETDEDPQLTAVAAALRSADTDGARTARVLRSTLDQRYDGVRTGRYRWDDLHKTEKTHCGTLVEINMQREFGFADGENLDFRIAGAEVDCKYSQADGRWMIPPEALGQICMVLWANDEQSRWKLGVVRATTDLLSGGTNRDAKTTLSKVGREAICWIFACGRLAENTLLHLPEALVEQIMEGRSGAERIRRLCRSVQRRIIRREVIATVAQQADYMKRLRGNGGARSDLQSEGIIILGQYERHRLFAQALHLPIPGPSDTVTARVVLALPGESPAVEIDGTFWRLAHEDDPVVEGPKLPAK